jgi:ribonuclease P protein component
MWINLRCYLGKCSFPQAFSTLAGACLTRGVALPDRRMGWAQSARPAPGCFAGRKLSHARIPHEAPLPTKRSEARKAPRLPSSHVDPSRARHYLRPAPQGPRQAVRVTGLRVPNVGRLRGRRAFADLAQRGRTVRSGPLRVRYLAAPEDSSIGPSVGYAIGKRTGGAVVRNRIRRRLRAAVSHTTTPLTSGFYLISTDPSAATIPFAKLVSDVDNVVIALTGDAR